MTSLTANVHSYPNTILSSNHMHNVVNKTLRLTLNQSFYFTHLWRKRLLSWFIGYSLSVFPVGMLATAGSDSEKWKVPFCAPFFNFLIFSFSHVRGCWLTSSVSCHGLWFGSAGCNEAVYLYADDWKWLTICKGAHYGPTLSFKVKGFL